MPPTPGKNKPFAPPSADQVTQWLRRHPPAPPSRLVALLPLFGLLVLLIILQITTPNLLLMLIPWLILGGLIGHRVWQAYRLKDLENRVNHAATLTMLRRHPEALRLAWRTLPLATQTPDLHGRLVAQLAHNLDQVGANEQAIAAYSYLLEHMPPEHPGAVQIRIHRAMAQLANEQLADADDALRKLRGTVENYRNTPLSALYRLASLTQQVRTLHFADAVTCAPTLIDDLRPLGVSAGFGYALMAWSYHNLSAAQPTIDTSQTEIAPATDHARHAREWWQRATILLPIQTLIERYKELTPLPATVGAATGVDDSNPHDKGTAPPPA